MKYIYVLSTGEDMQFEREKLHSFVVKTLDEKLAHYNEQVCLKDLSWNSSHHFSQDENISRLLEVDLDEIDNCDKYLVVLLGNNYGLIPHIDILNRLCERKSIQVKRDISIAELEIQYATILNKEYRGRVLFYFRDLDLDEADEKDKIIYCDDDKDRTTKLNILKNRIMDSYPDKVHTYKASFERKTKSLSGLDKFSFMVAKDLEEMFERDIQLSFKSSFVEDILKDSRRYFIEHGSYYLPTKFENVPLYLGEQYATNQRVTIITGEDGCGKTTLLSYLYKNINDSYKDGYEHAVPYVSGVNRFATNGFNVFKEIVYVYEQNLGMPHKQFNKEEVFDEEILNYLYELERNTLDEGQSLLNCLIENVTPTIIKGLHYLDIYSRKKRGIRNNMVGTHYYLTFEKKNDIISLAPFAEYSNRYHLDLLSESEMLLFAELLMNVERRNIPAAVIQLLVKKDSLRNPLYFETMLRYLMLPNLAPEEGNEPLELLTHNLYDLADVLSNDKERLVSNFIEDVANNINGPFVMRFLSLLAYCDAPLDSKFVEYFFNKNEWEFSSLDLSLAVKYLRPLINVNYVNREYEIVNETIRKTIVHFLEEKNYEKIIPNIINYVMNTSSFNKAFMNMMYTASYSGSSQFMVSTFRSILIKLNDITNKDEVRSSVAKCINKLIEEGRYQIVIKFLEAASQMFPSKEFSFLYTSMPIEFKSATIGLKYFKYLNELVLAFEPSVNNGNHFIDFAYLMAITRLIDWYAEANFDEGFTLLNKNINTIKGLRGMEVQYLNDYLGTVAHLLNRSGIQDLVAKHLGSNPLACFYLDNRILKDDEKKDYYQTIFKARILVELVELRIQGEILNELTWSMLRDAIDTYKSVGNTYEKFWEYATPRDYTMQVKASLLALHYLDYYRIDSFRGYDFKTPCEFMVMNCYPYSCVIETVNIVDHLPLDIFRYNNENNDLDFGNQHDEFYAMFARVVNRNRRLYQSSKANNDLEKVINSMVEQLYYVSVNYEMSVDPCKLAKEILDIIFQYCKNTGFNIESLALSFNKIVHCFDILKENEESKPIMLYVEQLRNYFIGNHLVTALTSYLFNWYVRNDDMLYQTAILELEESRKAKELDERFGPYYDYFEQVLRELAE